MKSTNVRELMNLLSDKYFGNDLSYGSNKVAKPQLKQSNRNDESSCSIFTPGVSPKLSPTMNRTSSLSQMRKNQNINYFQQSRSILQDTKNVLKRPVSGFGKNERNQKKKLEIGESPRGSDRKINNETYSHTYTRKYSQKDLNTNNQPEFNNYVTPGLVGVSGGNNNYKTADNKSFGMNYSNGKDLGKNANSRLVKQGVVESKGVSGKKLFLKDNNTFSQSKIQNNNSTFSNSMSSKHFDDENDNKLLLAQSPPITTTMTLKQSQQLQFYKKKCQFLQQQNSTLKQKVCLYEQQFNEQKEMVDNLKNMISKREQEINEIISNRLAGVEEKERLLNTVQNENQVLRSELNSVRELLREQQAVIIELYAKNKSKTLVSSDSPQYQGNEPKVTAQYAKNTVTSLTSHCSSSSRHKGKQNRPHVSSYLDSNARESIQQSSFEDE